ncbi:MAG TPA: sigma-70 family RNA polymerase sigma factor [Moheibacter sp.]|nr:sigma-70 family RNA polymerase sigma factor [Moheibacter sp.]
MLDEAIKEHLKRGDDRSLFKLYDLYKKEFLHYIDRFGISKDTALDLYQDAFIALRENAQRGKLDDLNSSVKTYFFAIGKYMAFQQLKQQKKTLHIDFMDEFDFSDHILDATPTGVNEERIVKLQRVLNEMGGKCKELLTLFYYQERKLDEIVHLMQYDNKDVAKSQKSRCIKNLKDRMK